LKLFFFVTYVSKQRFTYLALLQCCVINTETNPVYRYLFTYLHFKAIFKENLTYIVPYISRETSGTGFLQARCPSCHSISAASFFKCHTNYWV